MGDKVLLKADNFKVDNDKLRASKKLSDRFVGPFTILERIGTVAYKLELPDSMKIHNVFHISLLRPFLSPTTLHSDHTIHRPPPVLINDQSEYEVEHIVDKRTVRRQTQYLVHWLGYAASERTWVDVKDLGNATDLVEDFEDNLPLADRFPS